MKIFTNPAEPTPEQVKEMLATAYDIRSLAAAMSVRMASTEHMLPKNVLRAFGAFSEAVNDVIERLEKL